MSEDDVDQDDDESDSESDSWESVTDSSPESVSGDDCFTCSDTEDATVNSACKKFHQKVWAFCSPTKQGLWKDAQLEKIRNNHKNVRGSDYEAIKTEQDLTLDRDPSSFEVGGMMVPIDELIWIKAATSARNIYPLEYKTNVNGRMKALVQSLKQFHTCYYQLYEKGLTHAMVGMQGLNLCNAPKCPSISVGVGLKSFFPWCLRLGGTQR